MSAPSAFLFGLSLSIALLFTTVAEAQLPWITMSEDGRELIESDSKTAFRPWGFNYDRNTQGELIESYWEDRWQEVVGDFQEMKSLGANTVRIHLQFGAFMESPSMPRRRALEQLTRLVALAEAQPIYLNVTGLGCYHKDEVPAWYDHLSESERWQAQAAFWRAIGEVCANSPAVLCYNLMNEPVVPGGDRPRTEWLGNSFGGKHFVQFISLDRAGRQRHEIAKQWIDTLVREIRQVDTRHLITVGMVDWSLDRPGLTSGFIPDKVADNLDFLSVHLYPQSGKLDEALETLQGFASVGKPVVIEETFPLKCSLDELETFIIRSRPHAIGWISFYWGTPPDELAAERSMGEAILRQWLLRFQALAE